MAKRTAKSKTGGEHIPADARIVILAGKELFLQHEATDQVLAAVRKIHGEVDVFRFSGGEVSPADVLDECRSFGLLAGHKVIIVDDAETLIKTETRPLFERYAANPSEGATLILRSGNWRKGKFDDLVKKVGAIVPCKPLDAKRDEGEAYAWIGRRAESVYGVRIDRDAAALLIERAGVDLGRLDSELAKLAVGCRQGVINCKQVDLLIAASKTLEPWPLQEALLSGRAEYAIEYIRSTIATSARGVEIPLIFSASTLARDLHACAIAQKLRVSSDDASRRLDKKFPGALNKIYGRARNLSPTATAGLLEACVRADAGSKSGIGRADRALEMLAVRFSQVMR